MDRSHNRRARGRQANTETKITILIKFEKPIEPESGIESESEIKTKNSFAIWLMKFRLTMSSYFVNLAGTSTAALFVDTFYLKIKDPIHALDSESVTILAMITIWLLLVGISSKK